MGHYNGEKGKQAASRGGVKESSNEKGKKENPGQIVGTMSKAPAPACRATLAKTDELTNVFLDKEKVHMRYIYGKRRTEM